MSEKRARAARRDKLAEYYQTQNGIRAAIKNNERGLPMGVVPRALCKMLDAYTAMQKTLGNNDSGWASWRSSKGETFSEWVTSDEILDKPTMFFSLGTIEAYPEEWKFIASQSIEQLDKFGEGFHTQLYQLATHLKIGTESRPPVSEAAKRKEHIDLIWDKFAGLRSKVFTK